MEPSPANFEVRVKTSKDEYLAGERLEALVDGWYLFGAPMADAAYEVKLRLQPGRFDPPGWEGFTFGLGWWEEGRVHSESRLLAVSTGALDGQGKAAFEALLDAAGGFRPLSATLEAGVWSPERQRLFGRVSALVHPADLYLGIRAGRTFLDKGRTYSAQIAAVRPDGKPVEGVAIQGRLIRRDFERPKGRDRRKAWNGSASREVTVATFFTSAKTTAAWSHPIEEAGFHLLRLRRKTRGCLCAAPIPSIP